MKNKGTKQSQSSGSRRKSDDKQLHTAHARGHGKSVNAGKGNIYRYTVEKQSRDTGGSLGNAKAGLGHGRNPSKTEKGKGGVVNVGGLSLPGAVLPKEEKKTLKKHLKGGKKKRKFFKWGQVYVKKNDGQGKGGFPKKKKKCCWERGGPQGTTSTKTTERVRSQKKKEPKRAKKTGLKGCYIKRGGKRGGKSDMTGVVGAGGVLYHIRANETSDHEGRGRAGLTKKKGQKRGAGPQGKIPKITRLTGLEKAEKVKKYENSKGRKTSHWAGEEGAKHLPKTTGREAIERGR